MVRITYSYRAPERLEDDWREGTETPPDEMLDELGDDIENIRALVGRGMPLIPVEGRVSDYKSWLAAAVAVELAETEAMEVTAFAPQRTNRESAVTKLRLFGANLIEHPGRLDLCIWEPWRENVGHVDKSTCESIGCPYYLDSENDIEDRTEDALSSHLLERGGDVVLDKSELKRLGERADFCPAQLYLHARGMSFTDGAVNVATYAKAFADAAIADDDPLDSDVLLLDEAHTIAAEPDVGGGKVEPGKLMSSIDAVADYLDGSGERWAQRARREIDDLRQAIEHWLDESRERHTEPNEIFSGEVMSLSDAFDTLEMVASRAMQAMRRLIQTQNWEETQRLSEPYACSQMVRGFLSRVERYRSGAMDFVHSLYEEGGERINEMAFRPVDGEVEITDGTTPGSVFREWRERGTHPAIAERWGPLLDRYIESLWDGRAVYSTEDMPGAPMMPLDRLRDIAGADSVVTLSATHNELSDPTRPPEQMRPTRHKLLCAPVHLRARGSERTDYDGKTSVDPETPWFRELVGRARELSGDSLAAVPINYANLSKWDGMPVDKLENADGEEVPGIVPNSRGAIGEKGLEDEDIDTVMCGIQVQSPAPTARRLVQWWEMLAPRHNDPGEVLDKSWRLLAQHAVAGTIQAGGRFDWDATNLVFERPGLFELAGFEIEEATPESPGFAGEFCRLYEEADGEWSRKRQTVRAARVVGYLEGQDRKTPSTRQCIGAYRRMYDATEDEARAALRRALHRGRIATRETDRGTRFEKT